MSAVCHPADPGRRERSQLADFAAFVGLRTQRTFDDFASLHAFSVADVGLFWSFFLEWSGARTEGTAQPACMGTSVANARFFPGLRLSWPENLLASGGPADDAALAIIACDESGARAEVTRAELRRRVRTVAAALAARGLGEGDRVAAVVRNTLESVIVCLAVTSLGATWSSVAPDMGLDATLARLAPLGPKVLFVHRTTRLNGGRIEVQAAEIARRIPSLERIVTLDESGPPIAHALPPSLARSLPQERLEKLETERRDVDPDGPWRRFAFDHPLFVLFSSGTTGAPKCIVHGHGGTLLEHLKEHRLHGDLGPSDRLCFQTTTGWMMWNWTISALASGAALVLYDGSVSYPERDSLLRMAARERVTVFGTSPAYLQFLSDAGVSSAAGPLLPEVREMLSTGSVLRPGLHRWAREQLRDVPLQSISGGTDILGCFLLGSPWTGTWEGESSTVGLGFDVQAWSAQGPRTWGQGELVCLRPFPSRPVAFLGDPDGSRMRSAYFAQHLGAWTHGDLIEMTPRGSVRVLGRCDGVLNVRGIRIGPSEIYDVLSTAIPEVTQAMAVDAEAPEEPGSKRLVLFVVLRAGATLERALVLRIKRELKERASAAHVPWAVVEVAELPTTFSAKLSETAMQDALNGRPVRNLAALRNPGSVEKALRALQDQTTPPSRRDRRSVPPAQVPPAQVPPPSVPPSSQP